MYGNGIGEGFLAALLFVGALIGAAAVGLAWLFVVYAWPWLRAWLHAVTA